MAAGFSIETTKINAFKLKINEISKEKLTDEILERKLKIDLNLNFKNINDDLVKELQKFEPTGYGNFSPIFKSSKVKVVTVKPVGTDGKHIKLKLLQDEVTFDAIYFGGSVNSSKLTSGSLISVAYAIGTNTWNGCSQIQLKVKDLITNT